MALSRRRILTGFTVGLAGLLVRPKQALALGGTLPALGEPAPDFDLEGVFPLLGGPPPAAAGSAAERGAAEGAGASVAGASVSAARAERGPAAEPSAPPSADGAAVRTARASLADFAGRWLVLYFYPRDFTSGCTLEARGFQRNLDAFHAASAEVVGVSADDTDDHAAFCGSEGLVYPLLSDRGGQVSRRYGSWLPPFSLRHTFLIDPRGVLRASWTAVRPAGHASEVLAELERLQAAGIA